MSGTINIIIIAILLILAVFVLYLKTKKDYSVPEEIEPDQFKIDYLVEGVKQAFEDSLNKNIADLNLNKHETLKREKNKSLKRQSLKNCSYGDLGAKAYVQDDIKDILQKKLNINEHTIDLVIPFNSPNQLQTNIKFQILLYIYKKEFKYNALKELILKYNLADIKVDGEEEYYEITGSEIEEIYSQENVKLNYIDKLEIVTQRVYQQFKGHGEIDEIRDMKVDGISGGVSGIPFEFYSYDMEWLETAQNENLNSYNSIFIFFQGKTIKLSFLGFGSQRELIRVCKNIYRYENPGQLSEVKGFIANKMKDGSRVVTFRPPFSASWAFFIRKFDSIERKEIHNLITDEGNEDVIRVMKWLVRGYLNIIISGEQGSGKTTLLLALLQYLNRRCNLRIFEMIFELFAQKLYPKMNILNLRETDTVFGQEALDITKRTDGEVTILGEISTFMIANWYMQNSHVSKCNLSTHHGITADDVIAYFTTAQLVCGGYSDEKRAEQKAVQAINFDIHMVKNKGKRYIERITEFVPVEDGEYPEKMPDAFREFFKRVTNPKTYKTVDIVRFENGKYVIKNDLSAKVKEKIMNQLSGKDYEEFKNLFNEKLGECAYE